MSDTTADSDEAVHYLFCPRIVYGVTAGAPSKGRRCSRCPAAVWVSELMVPTVDSGELRAVCFQCVPALRAEHDVDDMSVLVHPRQTADAEGDPERAARLHQTVSDWAGWLGVPRA